MWGQNGDGTKMVLYFNEGNFDLTEVLCTGSLEDFDKNNSVTNL